MHFDIEQQAGDDRIYVFIDGAAVFSNLMQLKQALAEVEKGKTIVFQLNDAYLLDHSTMEFFHDFENNYRLSGGRCEFEGLEYHEPFSDHHLAARKMKPI